MEAVGIDLTACQPTALLRLQRARKSGRKDCGQGWLTPCITEKRKASQRWLEMEAALQTAIRTLLGRRGLLCSTELPHAKKKRKIINVLFEIPYIWTQ